MRLGWKFSHRPRRLRTLPGKAAIGAGVTIVSHTTVDRVLVDHDAGCGVVTTDGKTWSTDVVVVVAAGTGSGAVLVSLGVRLPIEGGYGYHVEVERRPDDPDFPSTCRGAISSPPRSPGACVLQAVSTPTVRHRLVECRPTGCCGGLEVDRQP